MAVSVNLSTTSLLDVELANRIRFLLARHRLAADSLILEITETTLMADRLRGRQVVQRLHGPRSDRVDRRLRNGVFLTGMGE